MAGAFAFDQLTPSAITPPSLRRSGADAAAIAAEHARALEAAFAAGVAEGRRAAEEEVAERITILESSLTGLGAGLVRERELVAERVERAAVELALRIAEQALGAAVAVQPERVVDVVRGALRRLVERDRVTVLVNPADLELVRSHLGAIVDELGGIEHCEVQSERRVSRGGAVVRTADGEIDATLQTKLERAREVLEGELAGAGDEH
jgi:flagellar assembly protein FliH